ncbi:betaine lipid [Moniliophthora roreri]|nr:betaine lipid [Moniliophthora roreri]
MFSCLSLNCLESPVRVTAALVVATCLVFFILLSLTPQIKFIWYCFIKPIGAHGHQKSRLDKFYEGQADVYDATRRGLLRGRKTMLNLSAAHLRDLHSASGAKRRLVWLDIGGGTGHNIELMNDFFPISSFDAIYLIDLCEPLLQVARKRFAKRGWNNVHILCQDASNFTLPEWSDSVEARGSVSFVTLSYSLSMIPNFYTLLDRVDYALSPQDGLIGVVDFYTAGRQSSLHEKAIGGEKKECGWLSRWFWQIWFDVHLGPARRSYLEYRFGTVKSYNGRNRFVLPFIVRIPYYIWLGRPRSADVSRHCYAFEVDGGNTIGNCSPSAVALGGNRETENIPPLELSQSIMDNKGDKCTGAVVINVTPPLSSFHYHINSPWRLPYYESPMHKEFRTFIYSFTWEDPAVDMMHLDLTGDDSMLAITSAGDNAFHYALSAAPQRIHCVDMNPCQGHLMELKLAAIKSLDYEDFFSLFGKGYHPSFRALLDSRIAPYLSSSAYQFWCINSESFSSNFYFHGYSGWALCLARIIFRVAGVHNDIKRLCECKTLNEQVEIWKNKLKPVLLNPIIVALAQSPIFCWNALGVPMNQRRMVLTEGGVYKYLRDTFDPLASAYLFKTDNYFYHLALMGHYTHESCPSYLTRAGFEALKALDAQALDTFRLHTDSMINVLRGLMSRSLTRVLIMDHLDWFPPDSQQVEDEVKEFARVVALGGYVLWRSASREPWYNQVFERFDFKLDAVGVRQGPDVALDRVNMYASFWKAVKM